MTVNGKCYDCGKQATNEWLVTHLGTTWTMKYCDECRPKIKPKYYTQIDGK